MAPPVLLKSRKTIKAVSNMGAKGIQRFHCSRCPHRLTYLKGEPRQEGYIVLQFGQQYCTAGKKYRMFKKKDPKIYPPNWCPKLKKPCEFRVYDFKDANTWYLHTLLKRKSPPDGYQYAVRLSGTVNLTPSAFFSMAKRKGASELLGVMVKIGEIVEIDDGLTSNCFYLTLNGVKYLPYWDTARARKNEYACKNTDN